MRHTSLKTMKSKVSSPFRFADIPCRRLRSGRHQGSQKSEYSDGSHVVRRIEAIDMGEPGDE
jgi:hypothetical protein